MSYIDRKIKDIDGKLLASCHNGEGPVRVRQLLGNSGDFDSCMNFMHETVLAKGSTIGIHPHEGTEELYYVISGEGEMEVDGNLVRMGPGDVCLTKQGSSHGFRNVGSGELKIIVLEADV